VEIWLLSFLTLALDESEYGYYKKWNPAIVSDVIPNFSFLVNM
jgi:hypothetical protein